MFDREQLLDELARVFARAAVDALLASECAEAPALARRGLNHDHDYVRSTHTGHVRDDTPNAAAGKPAP